MYVKRYLVVTWNCCRLGARSVCTIQPCISSQCHFRQSHIGRVHVCLAVTCHRRFGWPGSVTAVTHGSNEYRNKTRQQKLDNGKENSPATPDDFSSFSCRKIVHMNSPQIAHSFPSISFIYFLFDFLKVELCPIWHQFLSDVIRRSTFHVIRLVLCGEWKLGSDHALGRWQRPMYTGFSDT